MRRRWSTPGCSPSSSSWSAYWSSRHPDRRRHQVTSCAALDAVCGNAAAPDRFDELAKCVVRRWTASRGEGELAAADYAERNDAVLVDFDMAISLAGSQPVIEAYAETRGEEQVESTTQYARATATARLDVLGGLCGVGNAWGLELDDGTCRKVSDLLDPPEEPSPSPTPRRPGRRRRPPARRPHPRHRRPRTARRCGCRTPTSCGSGRQRTVRVRWRSRGRRGSRRVGSTLPVAPAGSSHQSVGVGAVGVNAPQ